MNHEHQWEPWQTTADQLGAISPDADGVYWCYHSRCQVMGCRAVRYISPRRYAENLGVVGKEKLEDES